MANKKKVDRTIAEESESSIRGGKASKSSGRVAKGQASAAKGQANIAKGQKAVPKDQKKPAKTAKDTSKKEGIPARIGAYFRNVRSELKRVTWPTRTEVFHMSLVVVFALIFFSIFIYLIDSIVTPLLVLLSGIGG